MMSFFKMMFQKKKRKTLKYDFFSLYELVEQNTTKKQVYGAIW